MIIKLYLSYRRLFYALLLALAASPSHAQKAKKLDSLFETLYKKGGFNGCVLIAEDGKPIYNKAFGYADFATKRLLDNNTVFELASVSKQFTAMAIMQLHQAGKLNYSDTLQKYFPLLPYKNITIDNLLHHTSGLPEFLGWNEKLIGTNHINYNVEILTALIKHTPMPYFNPGDQMIYSNTNYVLLALIVEKVSGMPFADYMSKYIFKPLDMKNTSVYAQRATKNKIKNHAVGHVFDPNSGNYIINDSLASLRYEYYFDGIAGPAGISSNVLDLLKWDQALNTEKLVRKQEQALAYIPSKLNNGKNAQFLGLDYGFGWFILPSNPAKGVRYMHTGGIPGYKTVIVRYPEAKKTIIILSNTDNSVDMFALCRPIVDILFNNPFNIPKVERPEKSIRLTTTELKALEGVYKLTFGVDITITCNKGQVYAKITGQPKAEIYAESATDFFYTVVPAKIKFKKNNRGEVITLDLLQNGGDLKATKAD